MNIWDLIFLQPLLNALLVFYHLLFNNLGLAIIALTIFIRIILTPLIIPSLKAMQKMREFAPELAKIKEKHKGDKAKLMQAQADFYKSRGVNPVSGCLPQVAQIIVLIALFQVFIQILSMNGDPIDKLNKLAYPALKLEVPVNTDFLYLNLTKPDTFRLPGLPFPLPGPLLIAAALIQFLSSKMLAPSVTAQTKAAKKTPGEADDIMAATQKQMLYLFPLLTIFIGFTFASGLVLYWFIFSLSQSVQQYFVSGWGGLTPWLQRMNLVKLRSDGKKRT